MTKFKKGEAHQCDESCKVNHTTDFARKNKLPSGSKVKSTVESATKAFKKQTDRVKKTNEFSNAQKTSIRKEKVITIRIKDKKEREKISIPLKELTEIAESSKHVEQIAMEVERALIRMRRLEKDLAD
jgi:hypothetical protein